MSDDATDVGMSETNRPDGGTHADGESPEMSATTKPSQIDSSAVQA